MRFLCLSKPFYGLLLMVCFYYPMLQTQAQKPRLLKDFATGNKGSAPDGLVSAGNWAYFSADDGIHGRELWKTDGSEGGTTLVKDLCAGVCGAAPKNLCAVNGIVFFTAYESDKGTELWRSDGSEKGTFRVKDINNGSSNFSPRYLTNVNGILFFTAHDGRNGAELWKSDGTEAGTRMVKDLIPGAEGANPAGFCVAGAGLYFKTFDKAYKQILWYSDGSETGTVQIGTYREISHMQYNAERSILFFANNLYPLGYALYALSSASGNPVLIKSIDGKGPAWSGNAFLSLGKYLYFSIGSSLWRSDGTANGTEAFAQLGSGVTADNMQAIGTHFLFNAEKPEDPRSNVTIVLSNTWISDGTAPGTRLLSKATLKTAFRYGDRVVMAADDHFKGIEYWHSTLKPGNAAQCHDLVTGHYGSDPGNFSELNGKLLFFAGSSEHGRELFTCDAKTFAPVLLKNINTRGNSSAPFNLKAAGGLLYFMIRDENGAIQLWKTTSKTGSSEQLHVFNTIHDFEFEGLCEVGNKLFFSLIYANAGKKDKSGPRGELWVSDGSKAGTRKVFSHAGISKGSDQSVAAYKGKLYFNMDDGKNGTELWCSDGTEQGTTLVKDILRGAESSSPQWLTVAGNYLYFTADNYNDGNELWKTDGSSQGTVQVKDIYDGGASADPVNLQAYKGLLFFAADDGVHGLELWCTDGSETGTKMIADIRKGAEGSVPEDLTECNGLLFFSANNGRQGIELWKTDGSEAGTSMVADLYAGGEDSNPGELRAMGNVLFFTASDGKHGVEIWKSDGREKGTEMVKDIQKGITGGGCRNLTVYNGLLYFVAVGGLNNPELWVSNGKAAGTSELLADYSSSNLLPPMFLCAADNSLYFVVDEHFSGTEIWVLSSKS